MFGQFSSSAPMPTPCAVGVSAFSPPRFEPFQPCGQGTNGFMPAAAPNDLPIKIKVSEEARVFSKTRLCKFFPRGTCKQGEGCTFAHGDEELEPVPEHSKAKLCPDFLSSGSCRAGSSCKLIHSWDRSRARKEGVSFKRFEHEVLPVGQVDLSIESRAKAKSAEKKIVSSPVESQTAKDKSGATDASNAPASPAQEHGSDGARENRSGFGCGDFNDGFDRPLPCADMCSTPTSSLKPECGGLGRDYEMSVDKAAGRANAQIPQTANVPSQDFKTSPHEYDGNTEASPHEYGGDKEAEAGGEAKKSSDDDEEAIFEVSVKHTFLSFFPAQSDRASARRRTASTPPSSRRHA